MHRATGLYVSGAIKELPIWYAVYKKYPPDIEPMADRPLPELSPIPEIVFEQDIERAQAAKQKIQSVRKRSKRKFVVPDFVEK